MKRIASVCVVLLALVPSAGATESTIYPGVGIGRVKLGMTQAQVKQSLGKWRYSYADGGRVTLGWGLAAWTVVLDAGKVVEVDTSSHAQRTPTGVGPGSPWHALARAYPHGICVLSYRPGSTKAELLVPHKGGTQTIYFAVGPANGGYTGPWVLSEVHVRTPWMPLLEFDNRNGAQRIDCKSTWRTGDPG